MGIDPGPNGYDLGIPCPPCMGLKTPLRVLAIVGGVKPCPPKTDNPNDFIIMTQAAACKWEGSNDLFNYTYNAAIFLPPFGSYFNIGDIAGRSWFSGFNPVFCRTNFTNDHEVTDCSPFISGFGGSAGVYWGPGI